MIKEGEGALEMDGAPSDGDKHVGGFTVVASKFVQLDSSGPEVIDEGGPVSVVVRHQVKPGKESLFEEWLRGISRAAQHAVGHLGFHIVRPTDPTRPEYLVFLRFGTLADLEAWESSDARRHWIDQLETLTASAPSRERHTGMEVWFTPPAGRTAPPRHKMVLVTLLALYPLVVLVQSMAALWMADWPLLLRTLATSVALVCLMTYGVMPVMSRLFSRWLYSAPPASVD